VVIRDRRREKNAVAKRSGLQEIHRSRNGRWEIVESTRQPEPIAVADFRGSERSRRAQLSPREHEILGLLSEGLTGQAIARRLFLSPETVRTHIRNATMKLGAKTRVHAVALMLVNRDVSTVRAPSIG
jgi:DNA-binding CsgD family transcriptional regulator